MNNKDPSDSKTKPTTAGGRPVDYDPKQLWTAFDEVLYLIFVAAHELLSLSGQPWFFTMDGFSYPFYGKAQRYGKNAIKRTSKEMTYAGNWGTGAFRSKSKKGGSDPMYRGTLNKHDYFQVNGHLADGLESFPLGYRPFLPNVASMTEFIAQMGRMPTKPFMGFLDKEFGNDAKTRDLRRWADGNRVGLMIPLPKHKSLRKFTVDRFNDGSAKPIRDVGRCVGSIGRVVYWHVSYQTWGGDPSAYYHLVTFYFEGDPRKSALVDPGTGVLGLGNNIYTACYLTNLDVDESNILFLHAATTFYWSAENIQQREKKYLGRAEGTRMFWRHFLHGAGLVQLALYALWRIERRLRLADVEDPRLAPAKGTLRRMKSHRRFFGAIRRHCGDFFVPDDAPRRRF